MDYYYYYYCVVNNSIVIDKKELSLAFYKGKRRHIVIDGSNVAMAHGGHKVFFFMQGLCAIFRIRVAPSPYSEKQEYFNIFPEMRRCVPPINSKPISK